MNNSSTANHSFDNFKISGDLGKRLIYTLLVLLFYRVGTYVPIPFVNASALKEILSANSGGLLGMYNMFAGGAISRAAIFALNVMPYIIGSIVVQLCVSSFKSLSALKEEGQSGRSKISTYTRIFSMLLCFIQGYFIVSGLEGLKSPSGVEVFSHGLHIKILAVLTLLGGFISVTWLGEKITENGIGNGISLIIVIGIIVELPTSVSYVLSLSKINPLSFVFVMLMFLAIIFVVIICERSIKKIAITYPRSQAGARMYNPANSYLPLKLNISGVIPPIFASAFLSLPFTMAAFFEDSIVADFVHTNFSPGSPLYIILFAILIIFFAFFYVGFVFNEEEVANNIKKSGGLILGKRPGASTANYLSLVVRRLTFIGSIYLCVVCIIPDLFRGYYHIPFALGGTGILIIVNVILDTIGQMQSYIVSNQYKGNKNSTFLFKQSMSKKRSR